MRLVLDTNLLVAGLLSPYGPPAQILPLLLNRKASLCYDARIIIEYRAVLARPKFGFDREAADAVIDFLEYAGELFVPTPWPATPPDPDDAMFLEVACAARADCLVTGNLKHFPKRARRTIRVLSPAEAVKRLIPQPE